MDTVDFNDASSPQNCTVQGLKSKLKATHTHTHILYTVLTCVTSWSWVLFVILCNHLNWDYPLSPCIEETIVNCGLWTFSMIESIYYIYLFS